MTPFDAQQTGKWIASVQLPTGAIPWFDGGHLDPWDHVQAAMGLATAGLTDEAVAAYEWLRRAQRPDGSWARKYWPGADDDGVEEPETDANYCAYVATGLWHLELLGTDTSAFAPMLERAVDVVLELQRGDGPVAWARGVDGKVAGECLVTGNSSVVFSLRCAARLADRWGHPRPHWTKAADGIADALAHRPELFTPKPRFSMDWYYPVMTGVLEDEAAQARLDERWDEFVVPGFGARCVTVNPWVTGGETLELVLALVRVGRTREAEALYADIQHLRDADGSWWTGLVYSDEKRWPIEQSTWTAGTALLAHDALTGATAAAGFMGR
ncbi:prenyltransferase [Aeromicrobium sp. 179-A 4D2 NHS]|uniref:prenyltransferase n=1 Tax=Aeromicrobium sp. 179-A 4D2 NHS TaxID=3142375 RepID=UPI0039A36A54